ncbi:MAG TPA: hypothetical protein VMY35_20035 [Phycisphaerae bacterium]|nr:hypothetical protein [Phycisphaerae bacterium]
MKRLLLLLCLVMLAGCASYTETWRGPAGKATPVCEDIGPGTGYKVGGREFIPVGYYTWKDVHQNTHREMVYVLRPQKGGTK